MTTPHNNTSLHGSLVSILSDYLGPAGERFLDRQIEFHLNIKPEAVDKADLDKLEEWVKVSLALLTEDKSMVDKCIDRIDSLK